MKNTLLLSVFCLIAQTLTGQSYSISPLGMKEGLSSNYVVSIAQDKKGFLWFATEEGLNKFDGIHFIPYYKEENSGRQSITGNELNCILDDPVDSVLWIATQRSGLNVYNYATNTFHAYRHDPQNPESLITDDITSLIPAQDGNIWLATFWKGVEYFDKQQRKFVHYNTTTVPDLPSDNIWSIADGGNGLLYIGHVRDGFSVLSVKDKKVKNFRHDPSNPNSIPGNGVLCIYKDRSGNVWLGTDKGLALYNPQTDDFKPLNNSKDGIPYRVYDIRQLNDGKLWMATEFGGIAILDLSQHFFQQTAFTFIREGNDAYSLSNASIRCIFQDSYDNVWAGTWGGGINFIRQSAPLFNAYQYSPFASTGKRLTSRIASAVCLDNDGKLWIGTDGDGINVFEDEKLTATYNRNNSPLEGNTVQAALRDSEGGLWFGLFYGGIAYLPRILGGGSNRLTIKQIHTNKGTRTDVRSFFEDRDGHIWVGTSEGIYQIDRKTQRITGHYERENNQVRYVLKDSQGQIWVGFYGSGLALYDASLNLRRLFNVQADFPSNTINHLYEDSHHRLWAATGEGLVCFPSLTEQKYCVYRREDGLENTHIRALTEDRAGNIWMSTNRGISCLNPDNGLIRNYDHHDDLPIGSFNSGCVTTDNEGNCYFGSINGLCYFNPENVLKERQAPPVFITHLKTSPFTTSGHIIDPNQSILLTNGQQNIDLAYKQNSFTLSFNIQNYALVNQVEYAYRMKGMDNAWYISTSPNNATFHNLPPGNYQFMVKARMRNQDWSEQAASLNITIHPPLWLTGWAKALYVLFSLGILTLIAYIYKKRLKAESLYKLEKQSHEHEQELNNERLRFYSNIAHELRTPLTLIVGPLEDLQKRNSLSEKDSQKISVIHQSAIRLLNLINQLLEFRKTETQNRKLRVSRSNIVTAVRETGLKYIELNRDKEVNIRLTAHPEDITMYFDKEVIQIILDNLISNAIKYTEKGTIHIDVSLNERNGTTFTDLTVSDTGYGISSKALPHIFDRYYQEGSDHQASGTGIGLSLVKSLVELHEGEIHVTSRPNAGSTFRVSFVTDNFYPNALHDEPHPNKKTHDKENTHNNKPILLVVEDNEDIGHYIADSLAHHFEVKLATNGKEGHDIAIETLPDIIVSDIMMPIMDGIEMCRTLKKDLRTSHIPIILLTAKDSIKDKEEGYLGGADSYLTKPFSAGLLHSRIENLLQTRRKLAKRFSKHAALNEKTTLINDSLNKVDKEFIEKIEGVIAERLDSDRIDTGYLADKMCMSNSTLYRKIKAVTGLSTNEYIRKIRMKYAEKYLLEGKYNISEIAFKVGINNMFYFRQCFKEEFGVNPSEYLKELKGNHSEEKEK